MMKEKEEETRQSRDLALNVSIEMCVKITISLVTPISILIVDLYRRQPCQLAKTHASRVSLTHFQLAHSFPPV